MKCDDEEEQNIAPEQFATYPYPSPGRQERGFNPADYDNGSQDEESICRTFDETICTTRYKAKNPGGKLLPDVACEKFPRKICGSTSCRPVKGQPQCKDSVLTSTSDVPEESCDLNPQKQCGLETKLVPKLEPLENCELTPRNVCQLTFADERTEDKQVLKLKLCLEDDAEEGPAGVRGGSVHANDDLFQQDQSNGFEDSYGVPLQDPLDHQLRQLRW